MVDKLTAESAPSTGPTSRGLNITLWVLQVIVAIVFVMSGLAKLVGSAQAVGIFEEMGTAGWMPYIIGVLEILGAIGLLIPRLTRLAALAFVVLMAGAVVSHLIWGGAPVLPLILLVLAAVIVWGRRSSEPFGGR